MADARLSVELEAKIDKFQSQMVAAKASVKDFAQSSEASLIKYKVAGQELTGVSQKVADQLKKYQTTAAGAATAQKVLTTETVAATTATGGFSSGLGKAFSSLKSLAAIIPGMGVATLLLFAVEPIGKFLGKLLETKQAFDKLKDAQLTLIAVQQTGLQNAQKELVSVDALYRASQNQNLSLTERKKAVDLLQEQYPKYFKNLSDEQILAGNAATAYGKLKDSIIDLAYAKAAEDAISKKAADNLKLSYDFSVKQAAINRLLQEKSTLQASDPTQENAAIAGQILSIEGRINDKIKEQNELRGQVQVNLATMNGLTKQIDATVEKGGVDMLGFKDNTDKATQSLKELKAQLAQLKENFKLTLLGAYQDLPDPLEMLKRKSQDYTKFTATLFQTMKLPETTQNAGAIITDPLYSAFEIFKDDVVYDLLPKLKGAFDNFFTNILENGKFSFEALGQAIIKSFASVLASDATTALLGMLGNKEAKGKDTIFKSIIGLFGGGGAAATGGGFLATALPIAGIAAGAFAIGSALFKKRDRAPDPVYTNNGVSTPSSGSQGNSVIQVIMTARGRDLVGTLNLEGFYLSRVQNGRG